MRIKVQIEKRLDGWWFVAHQPAGNTVVKGSFVSHEDAEEAAEGLYPNDKLRFSTVVPMNY